MKNGHLTLETARAQLEQCPIQILGYLQYGKVVKIKSHNTYQLRLSSDLGPNGHRDGIPVTMAIFFLLFSVKERKK